MTYSVIAIVSSRMGYSVDQVGGCQEKQYAAQCAHACEASSCVCAPNSDEMCDAESLLYCAVLHDCL